MSREIKFSCMWSNGESWIDNRHTLEDMENGSHWDLMSDSPLLKRYALKHKRQYTGLKDRNGVEIYEGDVLRIYFGIPTTSAVIKVYFLDGCWMVSKSDGTQELPIFDCCQCDLEVIGNIHENPDLLK